MIKAAAIVLAIAALGYGIAAIATGSAGLGLESAATAAAPECLPAQPVGSAEARRGVRGVAGSRERDRQPAHHDQPARSASRAGSAG